MLTMRINERSYTLSNGRAFVVSTKGNEPTVRQFDIAREGDIESIVQNDKRFEM